jgi:hypothetical protein
MTRARRNLIAAAVVTVVAMASLVVGTRSEGPISCHPDPAAAIAATPAGGKWQGSGCYTTNGITVTKPITISGGTFNDPLTAVPKGQRILPPIIDVKDTHGVTIKNVVLKGSDPSGSFSQKTIALVNNAGIEVQSSDSVTLTNVTTSHTYGDGLELWTDYPTSGLPVTNLTVNGYNVLSSGRFAISPSFVKHATFNDVHAKALDFESDTAHTGSGYVTVTNSTVSKLISIPEYLTGPITFDHVTGSAQVYFMTTGNTWPVTISDSTLALPATDPGFPHAAIYDSGGVLTLSHDVFTRQPSPKPPTGRGWSATNGARLTFIGSVVPGPSGGHDPTSTVTVIP